MPGSKPRLFWESGLLTGWWQGSKRGGGSMQGLLRSARGTGAVSLLLCSVGQGKGMRPGKIQDERK